MKKTLILNETQLAKLYVVLKNQRGNHNRELIIELEDSDSVDGEVIVSNFSGADGVVHSL